MGGLSHGISGTIVSPPRLPCWQGPAPKNICIIMLSAIGDTVHVLPVVNALKRKWPECRITWVIQPVPHTLVANHPGVEDFIVFRRRRGIQAWRSYRELASAIKGRSFDLLLGLQVYLKAGLITWMIPASTKLGFDRRRARDGQWLFTNQRIPGHRPQHVQDQYFEFLEYLGVDPQPVNWGLTLTGTERQDQERFLAQTGNPICSVVVSTSKLKKNWSPTGYARVLEHVEREHALRPVIVGGPSVAEYTLAQEVVSRSSANIVTALGDDLRRLTWIIEGSTLLITPDTGPLHIARALGTPVVSLFGYTNPKRSGPYRAFEDLVVDGYAEYEGEDYLPAPTYRDGMKRVTVERVMDKVSLSLSKYASK